MSDYILKSKDFKMILSTDGEILDLIEEEFRKGHIKLCKIGQLIDIIHPDGENRPIVTAPFLFGRGLMSKSVAIENIAYCLDTSLYEASNILKEHPLAQKKED